MSDVNPYSEEAVPLAYEIMRGDWSPSSSESDDSDSDEEE